MSDIIDFLKKKQEKEEEYLTPLERINKMIARLEQCLQQLKDIRKATYGKDKE